MCKKKNIKNHSFSAGNWALNYSDDKYIGLYDEELCNDEGEGPMIDLSKDDVIAMAIHFGIIGVLR